MLNIKILFSTAMGKTSHYTLEEDYALVYSIWTKAHKNWGVHLADLQNNKHLFTVLDKEYKGQQFSSAKKSDQLRNHYNNIKVSSSKYFKKPYTMREFVISAEIERQISRLPTQEAKDQFKLEKEQQHAKDETYIKAMWDFIVEKIPKIEKSNEMFKVFIVQY